MAREQLGICAEPNLHGMVLLMNAFDGHQHAIRQQIGKIPQFIQRLSDQFSEANLSAVIAVGVAYWDTLYPLMKPQQLQPMTSLVVDDIEMPALSFDLFLQLRADRYDVLHLATQQCYQLIQGHVEISEQIHAFRYLDGRDLTGFVDNPDALPGRKKRPLALISESSDPNFSQGSYLHFQRDRLDLQRWQQLTQSQQEMMMGRRKMDGQRLPLAQLHEQSHAVKASLTETDGTPLPIIFQNMPYGQLKVQGLLTIAFSAEASTFQTWLQQRMGRAGEQNYDLLLDYTQADCGAAFFAPSISFLEKMAGL